MADDVEMGEKNKVGGEGKVSGSHWVDFQTRDTFYVA